MFINAMRGQSLALTQAIRNVAGVQGADAITGDYDLVAVVEATLESLAEQAQRKKLELVLGIDPLVPIALRGDPGRLRQVLTSRVGAA